MSFSKIKEILKERIMILDGAMGTEIQKLNLKEKDYRGERFSSHEIDLKGNNDILNLINPKIIEKIHLDYLEAGADIIETNTFNANAISQKDYNLEDFIFEMNFAGGSVARSALEKFLKIHPEKGPKFIAGSMGPTSSTTSINPTSDNPIERSVYFEELSNTYYIQAKGLFDFVDLFLIETCTDVLNAKAAVFGIQKLFEEKGEKKPLIISATIVDQSGRTLTGQTIEAFFTSVLHADLLAEGLNCSFGCYELRKYIQELSQHSTKNVICYPNAGMPDSLGNYNQKPKEMAECIKEFAENGWVNIVGGCCGTTPEHIKEISQMIRSIRPRKVPEKPKIFQLSGLEKLSLDKYTTFINVGERCNVAGSRIFQKLIKNQEYEKAISVAREQVKNGAQILDLNMDDPLINAKKEMRDFIFRIAMEPDIAKVPLMIDTSDFQVAEEALKANQGRCIINSISLKSGVDDFVEKAKKIKRYGAVVIVMAFDEKGQAVTTERKIEICKRSYDILTQKCGFDPEEIIFDPNVLAIGTGIPEHNNYGIAFIESVRSIKKELPGVLCSGGVSNLSFSFRGNNTIRELLHSVFLYHSISAGLDMGIVNPGHLTIYNEIPNFEREIVENAILNKNQEAFDKLLELAQNQQMQSKSQATESERKQKEKEHWKKLTVSERIQYSLIHGRNDLIEEPLSLFLSEKPDPMEAINGPLISGMNEVGRLFGSGQMFLPQVIKSAQVMKAAFNIVLPLLEKQSKNINEIQSKQKTILMATVKGDVHDIGKNIVGVILSCNNYRVVDLGVSIDAQTIVDKAIELGADIIGLSGLITPSLAEMITVIQEITRRKLNIPVIIGGAATSKIHTAAKMDIFYPGRIFHVANATKAIPIVQNILSENKETLFEENEEYQKKTRNQFYSTLSNSSLISYKEAIENPMKTNWNNLDFQPKKPNLLGIKIFEDFPIKTLVDYIDWDPFFSVFKLKGKFPNRFYPKIFQDEKVGKEAKQLYEDAKGLLEEMIEKKLVIAKGIFGLFPANQKGDDIIVFNDENRKEIIGTLHGLRQQFVKEFSDSVNLCISDFIAPPKDQNGADDYIGIFAVSGGFGIEKFINELRKSNKTYLEILAKALTDRIAEAFAEYLHLEVRRNYWGFESKNEPIKIEKLFKHKYQGIRPAAGYPSQPDHTEKKIIWDILNVEKNIGISLTENFAMNPPSSVSGLIFAHPKSSYFSVGKLNLDQIESYAKRKGMKVDEVKKWLDQNINFN